MARLPRLVVPNQAHHVIQRGTDLQSIFRDAADYHAFSGWLREAAKEFKVAIHAYVLLPTHLNLLVTPSDETGLGRMMQWVGRQYVPYFNKKVGRSGTLWQGRYKATVIDAERYLMTCSRYIECSPVHAGIVGNAAEYPFSSCAHHVGLKSDPLITDHPLYWALGNTPFEREAAFRQLIEQELSPEEMEAVDSAVRTGWALGTDKFKAALEKQTTRRVSPAKRGRPFKEPAPGREPR